MRMFQNKYFYFHLLYCYNKYKAIWGLANISGDSQVYRDSCLEVGIIDEIIDRINGKDLSISYVRNLTWLISNICRGKPYPDYNAVNYPNLSFSKHALDKELFTHPSKTCINR